MRGLLPALALLIMGAAPAPVADTTAGRVQGARSAGVEAFLGVPYAAPPLGDLRWRAPAPVPAWQGTRDATHFGPACQQAAAGPWGPYTAEFLAPGPFSEDCLTLSVWKPAGGRGRLPVLVFIHGGAFAGGGANVPINEGASLARRGIVVVSIQYRLGVFGFLAHRDLAAEAPDHATGTYGLMDQIAALHWIKANIAGFGGDPAAVTVAGESAGAASVNDLMISPAAKGLFARAIAFSGPSMAVEVPDLAAGQAEAERIMGKLGAKSIADLRALPADALVAATRRVPGEGGPPRLTMVPHKDGVIVPFDPVRASGPVPSPVPLLGGYNAAEMIDPSVTTPATLEAALRARYGQFADRLLALYPHATPAQAIAANRQIAADRYMAGMIAWSHERSRASGQVIHVYRHDHAYPAAVGQPGFGAFHSSELAYVFGTVGLGPRHFAAADRALVRQWQDRIAGFVRSGNPGWPALTKASGQVMVIGDHPGLAPAVSSAARMKAWRDYAAGGGVLGLM